MIIYYTYDFNGRREESRRLLKLAIAGYTGSDAEADRLMTQITTCGNAGKPCIPGFDFFSVSHSNNAWAVLFADSECGLDIQYPRKADFDGLASRFYAGADSAAVRSASDKEAVFFRIWTRREALIKALGTTVAATDLPSVMNSSVRIEGTEYVIKDIELPGAQQLYAAICAAEGPLQFTELIQE